MSSDLIADDSEGKDATRRWINAEQKGKLDIRKGEHRFIVVVSGRPLSSSMIIWRNVTQIEEGGRKLQPYLPFESIVYLYNQGISTLERTLATFTPSTHPLVAAGFTPLTQRQQISQGILGPVLILSLNEPEMYRSICQHMHAKLVRKAAAMHMTNATDFLIQLGEPNSQAVRPRAVVVTDPAISEKKCQKVLKALIRYVKESGGTLIMAAQFSSFITPDKFDLFIAKLGLPDWKFGAYHRATEHLNDRVLELTQRDLFLTNRPPVDALAKSYSQKAVHLRGVDPHDMIYIATPETRTQSMVFPPAAVDDSQTPTAFAKVGRGYVGWVGDVNAEEGTTNVVLAMCGL